MDWLVVLALNFTDGGSQVIHTAVPTKEACALVLRTSLVAYSQSASAPFRWTGTCIDLKNEKIEKPTDLTLPPSSHAPPPDPANGEPGTEQRS